MQNPADRIQPEPETEEEETAEQPEEVVVHGGFQLPRIGISNG